MAIEVDRGRSQRRQAVMSSRLETEVCLLGGTAPKPIHLHPTTSASAFAWTIYALAAIRSLC